MAVAALGGYLGGLPAYRQAAGADHAEDVSHRLPPDWHPVCVLVELPDGEPCVICSWHGSEFSLRAGV